MGIEGSELHSNWVKDGTPSADPVTESTPDLTAAPPADDSTNSGSSGTPAPSVDQADTSPSGSAAPESSAAQAAQDFYEALLDGKPFQIPKGVQLPWKRGTEAGHAPLDEILKSSMLERDYRIKTAELARSRREYEDYLAKLRAEDARMQADRQWIEEERERIRATATDPDELQRLADHYERYRTDPSYKKWVDDALAKRESDAQLEVYRQREYEQIADQATAEIRTAIQEIVKAEFPGVDPDAVRERYAQALQTGQADLSEEAIRYFARQEAQVIERHAAPLRSELDSVKAELTELRKLKEKVAAAEAHNASTSHAIERSKAPKTGPSGGAPPGTKPKPKREPFTSDKLNDVIREWSKAR